MSRRSIKEILMERDVLTEDEADDLIEQAREEFNMFIEQGDHESAERICEDWFGLEPDYLDEFM